MLFQNIHDTGSVFFFFSVLFLSFGVDLFRRHVHMTTGHKCGFVYVD